MSSPARIRLVKVHVVSVIVNVLVMSTAAAAGAVLMVAIVWTVLDMAGLWDAVTRQLDGVTGGSASGFDARDYLSRSRVLGVACVLATTGALALTVIAGLVTVVLNLAAHLGGVKIHMRKTPR